jgi:hypothetical protein
MIYTINAFICNISIENVNLKLPSEIPLQYLDITIGGYAVLLSLPFNNVEDGGGVVIK